MDKVILNLIFGSVLIAFQLAIMSGYTIDDGVINLKDDDDFESAIKEFDQILITFYAPWCGHCKRFLPQMALAAKELENLGSDIKIGKIDATQPLKLLDRYSVGGYPTIYFFQNGEAEEYNGGRKDKDIIDWMRENVDNNL